MGSHLRSWPEHLLLHFGEDLIRRGMTEGERILPLLEEMDRPNSETKVSHAIDGLTAAQGAASHHVQVVFSGEESYPYRLRNIYDCPGVLWIRSFRPRSFLASPGKEPAGSRSSHGASSALLQDREMAGGLLHKDGFVAGIVGTREPEPVALVATEELVERLPKSTLIVSGLARGIDERAHLSALLRGMSTVAVLGAGILCPGPSSNRHLWQGDYPGTLRVVSEFLPDQPARSYHFPRRNRIIAGLSDSLYLMQAPDKSGALISASFALDEGRELFAFDHTLLQKPGANEGARDLLQQGAHGLDLCAEDRILRISRGPVELDRELFERDGLRTGRLRPLGQGWLFDSG